MPTQATTVSRPGAPRVQILERIENPNVRKRQEEIENVKLYRDKLYCTVVPTHGPWSVCGLSYPKRRCLPMYVLFHTCHMESSAQVKTVVANSLVLDFNSFIIVLYFTIKFPAHS